MYESRTYDDERGEPVVVLVVTGEHDVSRLVHTLNGAPPVVEQIGVGLKIVRQLKRHNFGRAALALLAKHGGRDFTDDEEAPRTYTLGEAMAQPGGIDALTEGAVQHLGFSVEGDGEQDEDGDDV